MTMKGRGDKREGDDHNHNTSTTSKKWPQNTMMTDDPAPTPTPASNCSQGGSWVLEANDDMGEHQANNRDSDEDSEKRMRMGTMGRQMTMG
jgi:hypothetical protein